MPFTEGVPIERNGAPRARRHGKPVPNPGTSPSRTRSGRRVQGHQSPAVSKYDVPGAVSAPAHEHGFRAELPERDAVRDASVSVMTQATRDRDHEVLHAPADAGAERAGARDSRSAITITARCRARRFRTGDFVHAATSRRPCQQRAGARATPERSSIRLQEAIDAGANGAELGGSSATTCSRRGRSGTMDLTGKFGGDHFSLTPLINDASCTKRDSTAISARSMSFTRR